MEDKNVSPFFALVLRQKNIRRWGLMRSLFPESLAEHSSECAILAHALAVIGNKHFGKNYDTGKVAIMALFHDVPEVFTGDMPTPVKYANPVIRKEFANIEEESTCALLAKLPDELADEYKEIFADIETDGQYHDVIKAADRLCAYIKCCEEEKFGNTEFSSAGKMTRAKLDESDLPELKYFIEHFLPAFGLTLDIQQQM